MPNDPYAVLRALLRAEAVRNRRNKPEPQQSRREEQRPPAERERA